MSWLEAPPCFKIHFTWIVLIFFKLGPCQTPPHVHSHFMWRGGGKTRTQLHHLMQHLTPIFPLPLLLLLLYSLHSQPFKAVLICHKHFSLFVRLLLKLCVKDTLVMVSVCVNNTGSRTCREEQHLPSDHSSVLFLVGAASLWVLLFLQVRGWNASWDTRDRSLPSYSLNNDTDSCGHWNLCGTNGRVDDTQQ